ncbi:MAG: hypothetical protein ACRD4K_00320, partial [Candidatus Acidiferrales bacterium]
MRILLKLASILFLILGFASAVPAQDASKIIQQYLRAAGGAKALARIQTLAIEGTIPAGTGGEPGTFTFYTKLPNRYYSELIVGGRDYIAAYNGKSAWQQVASGEFGTMLGPEAAQIEAAAQVANSRLVNLKKSKLAAVLLGHAQVRGKDALQVEVTTASGAKRDLYFDPRTHLMVKESAAGPSAA